MFSLAVAVGIIVRQDAAEHREAPVGIADKDNKALTRDVCGAAGRLERRRLTHGAGNRAAVAGIPHLQRGLEGGRGGEAEEG